MNPSYTGVVDVSGNYFTAWHFDDMTKQSAPAQHGLIRSPKYKGQYTKTIPAWVVQTIESCLVAGDSPPHWVLLDANFQLLEILFD